MDNGFAIAILGPTASGKSAVAERLAERLETSILSADAFQVYRGMDIGTNKPENRKACFGLDLVEPTQGYSLGVFLSHARAFIEQENAQDNDFVICGGTGLYARALLEGYYEIAPVHPDREKIAEWVRQTEPEELIRQLELETEPPTKQTIQNVRHFSRWIERKMSGALSKNGSNWKLRKLKFGLLLERSELLSRIESRLDTMLRSGWLDEVRNLLERGIPTDCPGFKAIGYREIAMHLEGKLSLDETRQAILVQTRQYAKRQMTWLRKEPDLIWLDANRHVKEIADEALKYLLMERGKQDGKVN